VPLPARISQFAEFVEVANRIGGVDGAKALARKRSGKQFDPALSKLIVEDGELILAGVDSVTAWDVVIESEPALAITLGDAEFDAALASIANFVDLKSPYFLGHAQAVAELAGAAADSLGLDAMLIRRAGLVHGLGRLGISNAIWDKRGALGAGEWERVRLQPYLTERMLGQAEALAPLGAVVAQTRERVDGSGYPLGLQGGAISRPARVLAAAEAYQAMREPRPHRPELSADTAAAELRGGSFDSEAVEAVLGAAGHRVPRRRGGPAGLTAREVEVLRLVARGLSNKEIGARLVITPKTVGNHVEHIYRKIAATTRAAAGLYAMQQGLLPEEELPAKDGVNAS